MRDTCFLIRGTFAYCRTKEAIKRMKEGDIIQNCNSEIYYKQLNNQTYMSHDSFSWKPSDTPMKLYPCYEEWRSLSNLHYYDDLIGGTSETNLRYLTKDGKVLKYDDRRANKFKKRWFINHLLS